MSVFAVAPGRRARSTTNPPYLFSAPIRADGSGPVMLTGRARSGSAMPEPHLKATDSRKYAGHTCRSSAKTRSLGWLAYGRAAVERDRTHLAHALSVTPGEDGELQSHVQQLGGGRGHAHLAIRRRRKCECEVRSAQENKRGRARCAGGGPPTAPFAGCSGWRSGCGSGHASRARHRATPRARREGMRGQSRERAQPPCGEFVRDLASAAVGPRDGVPFGRVRWLRLRFRYSHPRRDRKNEITSSRKIWGVTSPNAAETPV